jgi:hypothetical protein
MRLPYGAVSSGVEEREVWGSQPFGDIKVLSWII